MKNTRIVNALKHIAESHGGVLKPETVIQSARPASSPLHKQFEWDNTKAAHAYRLVQARQLINVCVEVIEGVKDPVPVFVSLRPDRERVGGGYRVTTSVLSNAQMREQLLQDALAEMNSFRVRYAKLKELAGVFQAMRRLRKAA